jgi:hypothetical protein
MPPVAESLLSFSRPSCSAAVPPELPVAEVTPAWEPIEGGRAGDADGLQLPEAIDQRFFITSAAVFRRLLLETRTNE